jgi:hypothetical protein
VATIRGYRRAPAPHDLVKERANGLGKSAQDSLQLSGGLAQPVKRLGIMMDYGLASREEEHAFLRQPIGQAPTASAIREQ